MQWSIHIGRIFGAEVRFHASLLLLIPYVFWQFRPGNSAEVLFSVAFFLVLFASVFLHELSHTLMARYYDLPVERIVIWFLGGYAQFGREPDRPLHDLLITAAGPAINLFIALVCVIITASMILLAKVWPATTENSVIVVSGCAYVFGANIVLALFNLIPIYPLDGGRMVRAVLQMGVGQQLSNQVALIVSLPFIALLIALALFSGDIVLLLITPLLLLGALSLSRGFSQRVNEYLQGLRDPGSKCIQREDYDKAIARYDRILKRQKQDVRAYTNRGIAYLHTNDLPRALADFDQAVQLGKDKPEHALFWVNRGCVLDHMGNYVQALADYNHALQLNPGLALAYHNRAEIFHMTGNDAQAMADCNQAIALDPDDGRFYLLRSMLRYRLGDREGAYADADEAVRLNPEKVLVQGDQFYLDRTIKGNMEWLLEFYQRVLAQGNHLALAYEGRANAYRVSGHGPQALADYNEALAYAPRKAEIYMGRGQVYLNLGQYQQAAADFQKAARLTNKGHIRRQAEALVQQAHEAMSRL